MRSRGRNPKILRLFGAHVRSLRQARGWSQEEFAARCSLHRTYIGSIERGEQNVSLANIEKIAAALGTSLRELFSLSG